MQQGSVVVSTDWLHCRISDADLRIVDARFSLADPEAGRRAYGVAHLPGAVYLHLDEDLSSPVTELSGRHPLPDPDRFARTLGRAGIGNSSFVVAYDNAGGAIASRLWWMLRWLGHDCVALLDGGFDAWVAAGLPVTDAVTPAIATSFRPQPNPAMLVTAADIRESMGTGRLLLVDAREPERFRGDKEPIDRVAGRVPEAVNFPFKDNLDSEGRLLPQDELRRRWSSILAGTPAEHVACMCGSGVTACLDLLSMEIAGFPGGRLYAGSWSEWIRDPDRPIVTGP